VGGHVVASDQLIASAASAQALNEPQAQPSNFINDGTAVVIAASLRRQRKPFDG
jgi:hypothetical protein